MTRDRHVPDQLKEVMALFIRKPHIFQGSYERWYVGYHPDAKEEDCASFSTQEQAVAWAKWEES